MTNAPRVTGSLPVQLGAVAALYLLWLVVWLVAGHDVFGRISNDWLQSGVAAVAAAIAFRASRRVARPYPAFLILLGFGLALLAASWATYDPMREEGSLRLGGPGAPDYSDVCYAAFVFVWVCAWGYLALEQWRRRPPSLLTGVVFSVLIVGVGAILTGFYATEYRAVMETVSTRLDAATAALEFAALVAGLACILLAATGALTWMVFATAMLVASDMAYAEDVFPTSIEPVWMLAEFLLLAALLVLPTHVPRADRSDATAAGGAAVGESARRTGSRSGLSGVLILLSLGAVLLSVAVWLLPAHRFWKSFLTVLFVVTLVMLLVWITNRFDDTVGFLRAFTTRLHRGRLEAEDWREADPRLTAALRSTGLGEYLDALTDSAARLRQDVLFLGPERLYPPPQRSGGQREPRCFIVMPFSLEWSNEVHRALVTVCRAAGVAPVRGDDVFTPTDILDDIWKGLTGADFVVADITGRNPNVLYELGIAHTLAKPVLILSRNAGDIPIDLATRRVILYGQTDGDWREDLERKVGKAIAEILTAYELRPAES